MDLNSLTAVGLTAPQAEAYALLLETGELRPPEAAARLQITRTNAYKLLDKLVALRLAVKKEEGKKIAYLAANPLALASLTARYRAEAVAREEAASHIMQDLLAKYYSHSDKPEVSVFTGRKQVADAYRQQLNLREDIHFIHTKADVPMMSFDTMHDIRVTPARFGRRRQAIMSAPPTAAGPEDINYKSHTRSNLDITWAESDAYNSPVEWSATKSSLLIVLYATEPHAILIADQVVAGAFLQLWQLLSALLRQQPTHHKLAPTAN